MSSDPHAQFAENLANYLVGLEPSLKLNTENSNIIQATSEKSAVFSLDLTPFIAEPAEVTAMDYFSGINSVSELLLAYQAAKSRSIFEVDSVAGRANVLPYADEFLKRILDKARVDLTNSQARLIADWVKQLDVYAAVKAVESLLYSTADLTLLEIAPDYGWTVHFDHVAIRCGTQAQQDAERVVGLLKKYHGYVSTQFSHEAYYQFPDGWNAYPLYKILNNGQVLRIFVDQSDADQSAQIIQHWNRVYGYTAHHMAIRATTFKDGVRYAVPLDEVMTALEKAGINILTPTGHYTAGLLLQVFTQPEINASIPEPLKQEIMSHGAQLGKTIENAKLLELVSRKEMTPEFAAQFFKLYGLTYDSNEPLHSTPIYQYFLPAQAAHVIKTSQQVV